MNEKEKKREYNERVLEIEYDSLLWYSARWHWTRIPKIHQAIGRVDSDKRRSKYSETVSWVQTANRLYVDWSSSFTPAFVPTQPTI